MIHGCCRFTLTLPVLIDRVYIQWDVPCKTFKTLFPIQPHHPLPCLVSTEASFDS
jgi:hypothetical protein